jgi:hypothetical protein
MKNLFQNMTHLASKAAAALLTLIRGIALPRETPLINLKGWGWILIALSELAFSRLGTHWLPTQHNQDLYPLLVLTFAAGQADSWTISITIVTPGSTQLVLWIAYLLKLACHFFWRGN